VIGLIALVLLANATLLGGIIITREPAAKPLDAQRIMTASRPAVVLIQSNYAITGSLPDVTISDANWQKLVKQVQNMILSGQIAYSQAAAEQAVVNLVAGNPDAYFSAGNRTSQDFSMVATGSGFFVTEDGYLVTAAHVVSADKAEIRAQALTIAEDPQSIIDGRKQLKDDFVRDTGIALTDAQVDRLMKFWLHWIDKFLTIDTIDVGYYLGAGTVETGDHLKSIGARASVVSIDPTSTGHDIAIMKADLTGVPTLPLATSSPRYGDSTYVIGYPRQGYLQEDVPLAQTVPMTMTSGKVHTTESRPGGWDAWGTDAQLTHGNSGGPVLSSTGDVLGVVSYHNVDSQGNQVQGQGFFVPTQYIKEDLATATAVPHGGPKTLTSIYYHALAEGDIHRYKTELALLAQIQSRSSWDAYVTDDITSVQTQVLSGNDKTPPDLASYAPASAGSAAATIVLAFVVWVLMWAVGRRRRRVVAVPIAAPAEPGAESALQAATEVQALPPTPANGEPETNLVGSPHSVLRDSETIVQVAAPEETPRNPD
jgi:serine protease Do